MVGVMILLFLFMMTLVVPQVVSFLTGLGQELPVMTKALIATSDFVKGYWYVLLGVPILAAIFVRVMRKSSAAFAYQYDFFLLRLPKVGEISRKICLARFAHFFATMFQSGVPILTCLDTARRVVGNLCLERSLGTVRTGVEDGEPLSIGLRNTGEFPNLVVRLVKIGEDSGNLGETLNNVTSFYDRDVDEAVDGLVGMIEPILTAFAGLMMAWIVIAVVGPIYDSISKLG
jgi:type IV pilus assembly protein PilC